MGDLVRRAVLVTATEPEPRRYGKPVVLGGILDHLCDRLGPAQVHLILIGRPALERPEVAYQRRVLAKPDGLAQAGSVLRRVLLPAAGRSGRHRRSLQEAVLYSRALVLDLRAALEQIRAELEIWDTVRTGQYVPELPRPADRPVRRLLYLDDLFSERYAAMLAHPDRGRRTGGSARSGGAGAGNPAGQFATLLPRPAARLLADPRVHRPLLRLERRLVAASERRQPAWFEASYLISPQECRRLRADLPGLDIATLPALLRGPALPGRQRLPPERRASSQRLSAEFTFLGGFDYAPNLEGLDWFLRACRQAVLAQVPDVVINVVGAGTDVALPSAAGWGGRVRFLGWVQELDAVLDRSVALLSPLRTGSGVKIKVLEALARGLPVIATPAGVRGIDGGIGSGLLIGETPQQLAAAMLSTLQPRTRAVLSAAARGAWLERYAPDVVQRRYDQVFGLAPARAGAEDRVPIA